MTVAALAGRRIDAGDAAVTRFPPASVRAVRREIRTALERFDVRSLTCSAACGADLLALEIGADLGIHRRVVLPSPPAEFRATSVADRPGDWTPIFDRVIADLGARNDLVIVPPVPAGADPYLETNRRVLDEAEAMAREAAADVMAIVVWDGHSRGIGDVTEAFSREARRRGLTVVEISTLPDED